MQNVIQSEAAANKKSSNKTEQSLTSTATHLLQEAGFAVRGKVTLPGRDGKYAEIPAQLDPQIKSVLAKRYPNGLYAHQSGAISSSLAGEDVCLATATASGKSLVFMTLGLQTLLSDPNARVLVLYPAKALIQDQLEKWETIMADFDMKPGFIDGSVLSGQRNEVLLRHRLVLMTPDVAHAWFMNHLNDPGVAAFRKQLRLLVLDETHVYDGVFGTNMAFFLRRLQAVSGKARLVCSTATLGDPAGFIYQITGRNARVFGADEDGAKMAEKEILLARKDVGETFEATAALIRLLSRSFPGRFLVFGDSRKMVEVITSATCRQLDSEPDEEAEVIDLEPNGVLPYRAGYEAEDRRKIQHALTKGDLRGVVATSALELGLDIGEIDLVVLMDTAPSMKSFYQRLGRVGRRNNGMCIIIDTKQAITDGDEGLQAYLARPMELNWLYVHNRYAQYTNALCAAAEIGQINGAFDRSFFASLPPQFGEFLQNELHPEVAIPGDLYALKQISEGTPHREFPLRNGMEKSLSVRTVQGEPRGELSFSQALREAYPGAVYYYMAQPYRVRQLNYRQGEIVVAPERRYTTKPIAQVMGFPDFLNGALKLTKSKQGFMAEAEMQVSERVLGFKEKRGKSETSHTYGPTSSYSRQPLTRFIRTTGVCWYFADSSVMTDAVAEAVAESFCNDYGIQPRDIGIGRFHARQSPLGNGPTQGICLFDNTNGSLRLTERLAEHFPAVLESAIARQTAQGNDLLAENLSRLLTLAQAMRPVSPGGEAMSSLDNEWVRVIAAGETAMHLTNAGTEEVRVLGYRYTPAGLQYQLAHPNPNLRWMVAADVVEAINGMTKTILVNLMTGEEKENG